MNAELIRHAYLPDVTLGWLAVGTLRIATLEEGWRADPDGPGGQRREGALTESCVPDGTYSLVPHVSTKYPNGVYALVNPALGVYHREKPAGQKWGRVAVLIHIGNTTEDIEGCILVGKRHGKLDGRDAVLESGSTFAALRALLGEASHSLTIRPTAGTAA